MAWCEVEGGGLPAGTRENERLKAEMQERVLRKEPQYHETGRAHAYFREFYYGRHGELVAATTSGAKAEHLEKGENPRFVVTFFDCREWLAPALYEEAGTVPAGRWRIASRNN